MAIIYTLEDCIKEFGEPPICKCQECQENKNKVIIYPSEYRRYRKRGYPKLTYGHTNGKKITSKIEDEICKLYINNYSISDIGNIFNVVPSTIYSYLIKNNINIKTNYKENKLIYKNKNVNFVNRHERRKQLGWYSLNPCIGNGYTSIRGFQRHHVNFNDIIYIPTEYNQEIIHNLDSGYNMEIINTIAYFFLIQCNIKELNQLFIK